MSSRALEQGLSRTPTRLLLIGSPFLLVRFVVFCLLIYMSLTTLVFAAWNVGASRAAGADVDGATIFLIFNGTVISLSIAMALAGNKTSRVAFECAWTGIFTLLQIAASIFVTLSGPPSFCNAKGPLSICASFIILVPISWVAATLLLGYFITIVALCVSHLRMFSELWSISIYDIAWFDDGKSKYTLPPQLPPLDTSVRFTVTPPNFHDEDSDPNVQNQQLRADLNPTSLSTTSNVWWHRMTRGRAGRDHPFAIRRFGERAANHSLGHGLSSSSLAAAAARRNDRDEPTVVSTILPYYQSQYVNGWQPPQQESFAVAQRRTVDPGPSNMVDVVLNEDEPVPVGDRSQWVRAVQTVQSPGPYIPRRSSRRAWRK